MKRFIPLLILVLFIFACSAPAEDKGESKNEEAELKEQPTQPINGPKENFDGDEYKLVLKYIDNRAIVYMNDSIVYDSKTVYGAFDLKIYLTDYVNAGMTDLKVEIYNGKIPYNTASPEWKVAYDIYINDELVEFVTEGSKDGKLGLVHTEEHDLSDIW